MTKPVEPASHIDKDELARLLLLADQAEHTAATIRQLLDDDATIREIDALLEQLADMKGMLRVIAKHLVQPS